MEGETVVVGAAGLNGLEKLIVNEDGPEGIIVGVRGVWRPNT